MKDEKNNIIALALKQYKKIKNTAYLAVCMNFYLGLCVGELVALRTDVFSNYATTKTYYIFDEETPEDKKEAFEKALCQSVTKLHRV